MIREIKNRRLCFCGKLAGMSRRDAETLARDNGAKVAVSPSPGVDLIVIGEANPLGKTWLDLNNSFDSAMQESFEQGRLEIISETEFWRILEISSLPESRSFYTPAAIADMIGVSAATIRHWLKLGFLKSAYQVGKLPYFTFQEILAAKRLRGLFEAGYTPGFVAKAIKRLEKEFPETERILPHLFPTSDPKKILYSDGKTLRDSDGQRFFDFGPELDTNYEESGEEPNDMMPSLCAALEPVSEETVSVPESRRSVFDILSAADRREQTRFINKQVFSLCETARKQEESGDLESAVDSCRAALMLGGADTDISFQLAELLAKLGNLDAAEERYYTVLETDDRHLEALVGLGQVLDRKGNPEDTEIIYRAALGIHSGYTEVRYLLGELLHRLGRDTEAEEQLLLFRDADPDSTLAEKAKQILAAIRKG